MMGTTGIIILICVVLAACVAVVAYVLFRPVKGTRSSGDEMLEKMMHGGTKEQMPEGEPTEGESDEAAAENESAEAGEPTDEKPEKRD